MLHIKIHYPYTSTIPFHSILLVRLIGNIIDITVTIRTVGSTIQTMMIGTHVVGIRRSIRVVLDGSIIAIVVIICCSGCGIARVDIISCDDFDGVDSGNNTIME